MSELLVAEKWLYSTLSADATLSAVVSTRIYNGLAPPGASVVLPLARFDCLDAKDIQIVGSNPLGSSLLFQVYVVGEVSHAALDPAASRINALLHDKSGSVTGGRVISCVREESLSREDDDEGVRYYYRGGIYRLIVQSN